VESRLELLGTFLAAAGELSRVVDENNRGGAVLDSVAHLAPEKSVLRRLLAAEGAFIVAGSRLFAQDDYCFAAGIDPRVVVVNKRLIATLEVLGGDPIAGEEERRANV